MIIDLSLPRLGWHRATTEPAVEVPVPDLARRVADGDSQALAEVYDLYATPLYRVLVAILGSAEDAEDALQEVFARLANGRAGRVRELRPYLFTAARHEAYGVLRRRRREPVAELLDEDAGLTANEAPVSDRSDLMALLQHLPAEQREVIALKVFEDMTFAQIATVVRASPNTAASRYRYGIERLRAWSRAAAQEDEL